MQQNISSRRIAPILGLLGALGPLSIDMYLPGMPKIAASLGVGEGAVQFSLVTFFAGLVIGQLFFGPLSDWMGRKAVIFIGLALFTLGAAGCATATTAGQLTAWRLAQGLGGSIGMAIGFAVVRDLYTGKTAASLIALMMIVQGLAPILAPLLGTAIMSVAPWPVIFAVLACFGIACALLVAWGLPETRTPALRAASHPFDALRNYGRLIVDRRYISYVAATALSQGGFFAYLAASSFIFISLHGLTPAQYSGLFALNALGLMAGGQTAARLLGRFRPQAIMRCAFVVYAVAAVLLLGFELAGDTGIVHLAVLLFVVITAMAFVMSLGSVMALEHQGAIAGTASALMGALRFGAGTLASFAASSLADGTALPMVATIAFCGILACVVAFRAFPRVTPDLRARRV